MKVNGIKKIMTFKYSIAMLLMVGVSSLFWRCDKEVIGECNTDGLVSYAAQVQPIIQQSCAITGCHGFFNEAPFQLLTHQQVDSAVIFGNLLFAIKHQSPYPMPRIDPLLPEAYKLSDSLINIIECWINQGRKNN
jgi:hypothetical protein